MAQIQYEQTNLLGGVSQQPPSTRLSNQVAALDNMWPSPVDGLVRRMPTNYLGILEDDPGSLTKYHTIYRDGEEQYLLVMNSSGINAYNLQDPTATVTITDPDTINYGYLGITDVEQIQVLTVEDTTFILNTAQSELIDWDTPTSPDASGDGLIFLRQGNYLTTYDIVVEYTDTGVAQTPLTIAVTTWDGVNATPGFTFAHNSDDIMAAIDTLLTAAAGADFTVTRQGSVIRLEPAANIVITSIEATDGVGDSVLVPVHENVPRVEGWLPDIAPDGMLLEVTGDAEVDQDDYWVKFVADESGAFGRGKWEESIAPGIETTLKAQYMPHLLVNTGLNAFTWKRADWAERQVGTDESNGAPSFLDTGITGMFFYKNRLGLLGGPNVVMSETGEYYNFFRVSTLSLRDSDVIDVKAAHTKVANFVSSAPHNGDYILFTDRSQFLLRADDILSPRTVELIPAAEYEASQKAQPSSIARSVFFPFKRGAQSGVRELYQMNEVSLDATDITIQVPNYLQGEIDLLVSSTLEDTLLALTTEPDYLYVYKYLWSGQERAQSAWGRWSFNGDEVRHVAFIQNDVFLVVSRLKTDGVTQELHLEKLTLATGQSDASANPLTYLDRQMTRRAGGGVGTTPGVTAVFGGVNTVITIPWHVGTADYGVVNAITREQYTVVSTSGATITVEGDVTGSTIYIGQLYTSQVDLSQPLVKYQAGQNGLTARYGDPQHIAAAHVQFNNTETFEVSITVNKRTARVATFSGAYAEENDNGTYTGEFSVGVSAPAADASVLIRNSTPFQSNLSSVSWEILYKTRGSKFRG